MIIFLSAIAFATPDQPFPRADDRIRVRRYLEVTGEGPTKGRYRRRSGPIRAWSFNDGVIEHYDKLEEGSVVERHRFDAGGGPLSTTIFEDDRPSQFTVLGHTESLSEWTSQPYFGAELYAPPAPTTVDGVSSWSGPGWTVRIQVISVAATPFGDAFRSGLNQECGCFLTDRTTVWLDGQPAARYRLQIPDPDRQITGELWALSRGKETLLIASTADTPQGLWHGRAIAALLDWP